MFFRLDLANYTIKEDEVSNWILKKLYIIS